MFGSCPSEAAGLGEAFFHFVCDSPAAPHPISVRSFLDHLVAVPVAGRQLSVNDSSGKRVASLLDMWGFNCYVSGWPFVCGTDFLIFLPCLLLIFFFLFAPWNGKSWQVNCTRQHTANLLFWHPRHANLQCFGFVCSPALIVANHLLSCDWCSVPRQATWKGNIIYGSSCACDLHLTGKRYADWSVCNPHLQMHRTGLRPAASIVRSTDDSRHFQFSAFCRSCLNPLVRSYFKYGTWGGKLFLPK